MYRQVVESYEDVLVIKRSDFITHLVPVNRAEDAERELDKLRKKYSDATHNCYAYIVNGEQQIARFSDDGEPQGTAGMPILEVLKKRNINKTLAVVTRYFGGVKLGAGGLVSAYSQAVSEALDKANVMECRESAVLEVTIDYTIYKPLIELISRYGRVLSCNYDTIVRLIIAVDILESSRFIADITELSLGKIIISAMPNMYIPYKI